MLQDITDDMGNEEIDVPADDSGVLTKDQVLELASMQPLLVYEQAEDKKVKVAVLEGVRTFHHPTASEMPGCHSSTETGKPPRFSIRLQGVRKGELTYNARRTINDLSLVPVLALIDAELVDRMRVSPEALALGKAAFDSLNPVPVTREFVDMVVEDYVEADPINREFFLPSGEADTLPTGSTTPDMPSVEEVMNALGVTEPLIGLVDNIDPGFYGETLGANDLGYYQGRDQSQGGHAGVTLLDVVQDVDPSSWSMGPTSNPSFTGSITFGGYIQEPAVNTQELGTVEQVIPEPALIEDGECTVHVSDNLPTSAYQSPEALVVHPDYSPSSGLVDMAVEPMVVPGESAVAYSIDPMGLPIIETTPVLEPGVQEDGAVVPFDPAVHELPM